MGLKNTYIYNITMPSYPASRVFGIKYQNGKPAPDDLVYLDGIVGDGNIYSSVEDLYKWDQALYTEKLVKKETFKEAITSGKLNDGTLTNYGFAWMVDSSGNAFHSGGWVGFRTYNYRYINKDQAFILADNSGNYMARSIVKNIIEGKPYKSLETSLITNITLIDATGAAKKSEPSHCR